jgi:conjugal transfer/entry exclusion protein
MMMARRMTTAMMMAVALVSARPAASQDLGDILGVLEGILDNAEGILTAAEQIVEPGVFADLIPLVDDIQQVQDLLNQAQALSFNLDNVLDEFAEVFPEDFGDFDLAQTVLSINQVNAAGREAIERALELQAETVEKQLPSTIRVQGLRTIGAVGGPLAALQAMVQLQAEQFNQFNRLQTLLASQSRLKGLESAERSNAQDRARRLRELDDPTSFIVEDPEPIQLGVDLVN